MSLVRTHLWPVICTSAVTNTATHFFLKFEAFRKLRQHGLSASLRMISKGTGCVLVEHCDRDHVVSQDGMTAFLVVKRSAPAKG